MAAPGAQVLIEGANFAKATAVKFNGVAASFVVTADTQIQAIVPASALSGPVSVTTAAGSGQSTNAFIVIGAGPYVSGFSPTNGPVGATVIISGAGFTQASAVLFGGTNAVFGVTADTQIHAVVPAGAVSGPITIVAPSGTNVSAARFTIVSNGPLVTGFSPTNGPPGTLVTVAGVRFTGATAVLFGGTNAAFAVTSDTQLHAFVPTNAVTGFITVSSAAGTNSSAAKFVVAAPAPTITDFTPTSGAAGTPVVISGANFTAVTAVKFNGTNAAFGITSDTQIQAFVPTNATSGPLTIESPNGTNSSSGAFSIVGLGPSIAGFSPTNGAVGTIVTISGANFTGATNVLFNGVAAAFGVTSDSQIQAQVPITTTGPVTVITPAGTNVSGAAFYVSPLINSFAPTSGVAGVTVNIYGLNFIGATAVLFGGAPAKFVINSDTNIVATAPTNAVDGSIAVTTPAGIVATTNGFALLPKVDGFSPLAGPAGTPVAIFGSGFSTATTLTFNGAPAGFTVATPNEIDAVVPASATTGPIQVVTAHGSGASAAPFTVAQSGDLELTLTASSTNALAGANFTYTIVVTNHGPSTVNGTTLTNILPTPVKLVSVTLGQGTYAAAGGVVSCALGSLASQGSITATIVVTPEIAGTLTNVVTVRSQQFDPTLGNNTARSVVSVAGPSIPTLQVTRASGNTVQLTWPTTATNFVLQAAGSLAGVWSRLPNGVSLVNGHFLLTDNDTNSARFYRLALP